MRIRVRRPDGQLIWETVVKDIQNGFHATIDRLGRLYLPNADGPIVPPYTIEVEEENWI